MSLSNTFPFVSGGKTILQSVNDISGGAIMMNNWRRKAASRIWAVGLCVPFAVAGFAGAVQPTPSFAQSISPFCAAAQNGTLDAGTSFAVLLPSPNPQLLEGYSGDTISIVVNNAGSSPASIAITDPSGNTTTVSAVNGAIESGTFVAPETGTYTITYTAATATPEYDFDLDCPTPGMAQGTTTNNGTTTTSSQFQQAAAAANAQSLVNTIDIRENALPDADAGAEGSSPFVTAYDSGESTVKDASAPIFSATDNTFAARWYSKTVGEVIPARFFVRGSVDFLTGKTDGEVYYGDAGVAIGVPRDGTIGAFVMGLSADTNLTMGGVRGDFDTVGIGGTAYIKYPFGPDGRFNLRGTYVATETDATFSGAGLTTTTGTYDSDYFIVGGAFQRDFHFGNTWVTPSAGFSYRSVDTDSYSDSAGTFVAGTDQDNFSFDFDTRVNHLVEFNSRFFSGVQVYGEAGVRIFLDERTAIAAAPGMPLLAEDDAAVSLGFGWDMMFHGGGTVGLDFKAFDVGNDRETLRVNGKIVIPFSIGQKPTAFVSK